MRVWPLLRLCVVALLVLPAAAFAQTAPDPAAKSPERNGGSGALLGGPSDPPGDADAGRLDPDRPHLPEASTTVGKGRAVLESGFTMTSGAQTRTYSYPEALLRLGVFADWFEARVGQSALSARRVASGTVDTTSGFADTYLGAKVALTRQDGLMPAIALIPQMTVPTGARQQTAGRVLGGLNVDFGWDVVRNVFDLELVVANNQVRDDLGGIQHQLATGLTGVFEVTKTFEVFAEWDSFYPHGGLASTSPQHYAVGGLVYFLSPDMEVDARAGTGLNDKSSRLLVGFGFSVRR